MARRAVTRREVLDLSIQLFAAHGYRSTSLELVAERLGVTRQALYYHFKNKGEILAALFEEMMTKLESAVAAVPEEPADGQPRFAALLRAHIDVTVGNPALVALLLHERPEIAKLKGLRASKRRRDYARLFTDAYDHGVAAGQLRWMESWVAVNTLISAVNGASWWYHGETSASGAQLREGLYTLLSQGFMVQPPDGARTSPTGGGTRAEAVTG